MAVLAEGKTGEENAEDLAQSSCDLIAGSMIQKLEMVLWRATLRRGRKKNGGRDRARPSIKSYYVYVGEAEWLYDHRGNQKRQCLNYGAAGAGGVSRRICAASSGAVGLM